MTNTKREEIEGMLASRRWVCAVLLGLVAGARVTAAHAADPRLLVDHGQFQGDPFVRQIAVTRDDKLVVVSDAETGLSLYDAASGALNNRFEGKAQDGEIAYQPALDWLVTAGSDAMRIWDVGKQIRVSEIKATLARGSAKDVYLDPTGNYVFANNGKYDRASGRLLKTLRYREILFWRDFYVLLSGFNAEGFLGGNPPTRALTVHGERHRMTDDSLIDTFDWTPPIGAVSFHADRTRGEIYLGYPDGFWVYSIATHRQGSIPFPRGRVYQNIGHLTDSCVTSDGRFFVTVANQPEELVVLEKRNPHKDDFIDNVVEVHRERVGSTELACLSTRPQVIIALSEDVRHAEADPNQNGVTLFDVPSRKRVWQIGNRVLAVRDLAVEPAGKAIAVQIGTDPHQVVLRFDDLVHHVLPVALRPFLDRSPRSDVEYRFRAGLRREDLPEFLRRLWDARTRFVTFDLEGDPRPREISSDEFDHRFVHLRGRPEDVQKPPLGVKSPSGRFEVKVKEGDLHMASLTELRAGQWRYVKDVKATGVIWFVAYTADERRMALGGAGSDIAVVDLPSGKLVRRLPMPSYVETAAFSLDGKTLVCGTWTNEILVFDLQTGTIVRRITGFDGHAHDVALTARDRLLASTATDGALRFWELGTGKLLASAYFDQQLGFAVVTPQGYYDKSAAFDRLLWNVDGVPVRLDQYYEKFFRPGVVRAALRGEVDATLPAASTTGPPPLVRIVRAPRTTEQRSIALNLEITDRGGGTGSIRAYANGTAVASSDARGVTPVQAGRQIVVPLTTGENRIRVVAFNAEDSVQSEPSEVVITATYSKARQVNIRGLVVGIQSFANPALSLSFPVADAQLMERTLRDATRNLYGTASLSLLTKPEETTRQRLEAALTDLQTMDPNDLFVFYVATHGVVDAGQFYLLTSNVGSTSSRSLSRDALDQFRLGTLLMKIPAQKKLIIIDTCNAAALGDAIRLAMANRSLTEATAINVLSRAVGTTVLAASTATQEAIEGYQGHGLFTFVLVRGLSGEADANKDHFVKTLELADYIDDAVPSLAETIFGHKQFPIVVPQGEAFPIARVPDAPVTDGYQK